MFKYLLAFVICTILSLTSLDAISLLDIQDESKDYSIHTKFLKGYINSIYKSRSQYLKDKISHIEDENIPLRNFGKINEVFEVWVYNSGQKNNSSLLENNNNNAQESDSFIKGIVNNYKGQSQFFESDPFCVLIGSNKTIQLDISLPRDLALFYKQTTELLAVCFKGLIDDKKVLSSNSALQRNREIIEALFYDQESAMKDLVDIIRACRPILRDAVVNHELSSLGQGYLKDGERALDELVVLDAIRGINALFERNDIPAVNAFRLKMLEASWPKGFPPIDEDPMTKQKPMQNETTAPAISTGEVASDKSQISAGAIDTDTEKKKTKRKKKRNKKRSGTTASLSITPAAAENNRQKPIAHPVRNSQQDERPQPTLQSLEANLKGEKPETVELPAIKEKIKTRPDETKTALRSLNGLFDEKETAFEKAKKKLKISASESSSSSSSSPAHLGKIEHTRRLKTLRKLIGSDDSKVNVNKTLKLLEYFGLIKSTNTGHQQMKTKTVDMWLNGERTLIELSSATTIAVAHKSGSKSYFKPWALDRIKKMLIAAGFKKLLDS